MKPAYPSMDKQAGTVLNPSSHHLLCLISVQAAEAVSKTCDTRDAQVSVYGGTSGADRAEDSVAGRIIA